MLHFPCRIGRIALAISHWEALLVKPKQGKFAGKDTPDVNQVHGMKASLGRYAQRSMITIFLVALSAYLFTAIVTYTPFDPGWTHLSSDTQKVTNATGVAGAWLADLLVGFWGKAAILWPLIFVIEAIQIWWPHGLANRWFRWAGEYFWVVCIAALLYLLVQQPADSLQNASGGIIGFEIGSKLLDVLGFWLAIGFLTALGIVLLTFAFGVRWDRTFEALGELPALLGQLFYRNVPEYAHTGLIGAPANPLNAGLLNADELAAQLQARAAHPASSQQGSPETLAHTATADNSVSIQLETHIPSTEHVVLTSAESKAPVETSVMATGSSLLPEVMQDVSARLGDGQSISQTKDRIEPQFNWDDPEDVFAELLAAVPEKSANPVAASALVASPLTDSLQALRVNPPSSASTGSAVSSNTVEGVDGALAEHTMEGDDFFAHAMDAFEEWDEDTSHSTESDTTASTHSTTSLAASTADTEVVSGVITTASGLRIVAPPTVAKSDLSHSVLPNSVQTEPRAEKNHESDVELSDPQDTEQPADSLWDDVEETKSEQSVFLDETIHSELNSDSLTDFSDSTVESNAETNDVTAQAAPHAWPKEPETGQAQNQQNQHHQTLGLKGGSHPTPWPAGLPRPQDVQSANPAMDEDFDDLIPESNTRINPIDDDGYTSGRPVSRALQVAEQRALLSPLPGMDLLDLPDPNRKPSYTAEELERLSRLLEIKLKEFNVSATVIEAQPGPVVTRFELELAPGVKASKVTNISRDLARSMSMASVRVVEVIPGKPYIGIEVPNKTREMVRLIELLDTPAYRDPAALISMAMGKDIAGRPVLTDLAKAPHMLVAGTTGSGKSVAVNAMLLSMLLKYTPAQLRLILIDPKQLELANYGDIPHLLTPVVTDMKDAVNALNWSVGEMERRYKLMTLFKVRKIDEYNRKIQEALDRGEEIADPLWKPDETVADRAPRLKPLPLIVIVADEFADMIMQVGKKAEELITRLAQKSRASGIHLMLATQRPSVDVITGLIKANIPTRVGLRVNSKIDSRTILDAGGAEDMLGHGDMLFLGPGKNEPERVHGAFISDDEVNRICDAWRERGSPDYVDDILTPYDEESPSKGGGYESDGGGDTERDPMYDQVVSFVLETRKVSASAIQRKFSLGYNRAARIVDAMESAGLISPMGPSGKREILM